MEGEPFDRRLSRADMLRLAALAAGAGVVAGPAAAADAAVARLTKESGRLQVMDWVGYENDMPHHAMFAAYLNKHPHNKPLFSHMASESDALGKFHAGAQSGIRIVPGGSAVRDGAYLAPGVICMPPMYVNIGAWVGEGSMIDSHALVGSCAQVGARVHVSAAAQIGGVIEPVGALPVIVEDDVLVGGNTGIYEGAIVKSRAVVAAGTVLTGSTPVYDLVRGEIIKPSADRPLVIPEGAVVVPGARAVTSGKGVDWKLSLATPVIVKYRDSRTDTRTELEAWIR